MQSNSRPDERNKHSVRVPLVRAVGAAVEDERMQRSVQQSGVNPEPSRIRLVGQRHFGVHVVAVPPRGFQPLERRPVLQAHGVRTIVDAPEIDGHGPGRRPHGQPSASAARAAPTNPVACRDHSASGAAPSGRE